jgi:DHA1 family multidrug resistance protein-like MFS transporter
VSPALAVPRRLPQWQRGVWVLLADQVLMNVGFFMLFPLLTVHLTRDLGFDATSVGLVFAARNLVQQGAAPLGGSLSDRVGYKPIIVAGFGVRAAGFLLFALSHDVLGVIGGALITAVGGALFDSPSRASLAYLTPDKDRQHVYSAMGSASWLGQVVGPLMGALLLPFSFEVVSVASATAFVLAAIQAATLLPGGMRGEVGGLSMLGSIGAALRDRDFMWFTGLLLGFYFLATQTTITVPLLAARLVGPEAIGPLFAIQAALAMTLQVPLVRWTARYVGPLVQVSLAMLVMGLGFAGYGAAGNFVGLALATALVAIGQLLISPVQSTLTARLAGGKGGAYFGVGSLALAFGGALGNGSGGALIDLSAHAGLSWLPWLGMAAVAVISALGFALLSRDKRFSVRLSRAPRTRSSTDSPSVTESATEQPARTRPSPTLRPALPTGRGDFLTGDRD